MVNHSCQVKISLVIPAIWWFFRDYHKKERQIKLLQEKVTPGLVFILSHTLSCRHEIATLMNSILRWSILQWRSVISLCEIATWCCTQEGRHMQRPSKKQIKTVDYKLMMTQDLNYVQLKLNVEQKVHTYCEIWNSLQ